MTLSEDRLVRQWSSGGMGHRIYDFTIKHEGLYRLESRIVWRTDVRAFYAALDSLQDLAPGTSVLDVPSGGGVAFRGLRPDMAIRYVAADVSPFMLRRAEATAARRGLTFIEYVHTNVEHLPFDDATFDLCVSYNGLHCFSNAPAAVAEMARVTRPGGELRGTTVVTGGGAMAARLIAFFQRTDQFGDVANAGDVEGWLTDAGFEDLRIEQHGAYLFFNARRAGT
ncbi:MAG TPA: methyltransferase domain-containing protein [Streptosporangiaceae bacterium]|nr:methyltransferase domain-containing protein [Streptosporangiaceae bacterium]